MNRAERRRERRNEWRELSLHAPFDRFSAEAGQDAARLTCCIIRNAVGAGEGEADAEVFSAAKNLMDSGLLRIMFRDRGNGFETKVVLPDDFHDLLVEYVQ